MSIPLIITTSIPPPAYLLPLYTGCLTANLSTLTENTSFSTILSRHYSADCFVFCSPLWSLEFFKTQFTSFIIKLKTD